MNIQYQLTKKEFLLAMRIITRKFSKSGKAFIIGGVIIGFILLLLPLQILWGISSECAPLFSNNYFKLLSNNYLLMIKVIGLWTASAVFFVIIHQFPDNQFKRWAKKPINQSAFELKTITMDTSGVHLLGNGSESKVNWEKFGRTFQIKDFFLLEIQADAFVVIPKARMSIEDVAEIDRILKEHVTQYEVKEY